MNRVLAVVALLAGCSSESDLILDLPPEDPPVTDTGVTSNQNPDHTESVTDEGTVATQRPVAVCSVTRDEVTPPFQSTIFDGGDSYDPDGHDIDTWTWTLVTSPTGSSALLAGSNATRQLMPDLAGDYVARLTVTTDDGRVSEPIDCAVSAVPGDDLWVEMFWVHAQDDMDLHLIAPGGSYMSYPYDCYYANTAPSWGQAGTADDPRLDLDDIPGTGPENINIAEPSVAGAYTVLVHDFSGSNLGGDYYGANEVTVNIYIGAVLHWTATRTISGDGSKEYFAEINWPERTVTPL